MTCLINEARNFCGLRANVSSALVQQSLLEHSLSSDQPLEQFLRARMSLLSTYVTTSYTARATDISRTDYIVAWYDANMLTLNRLQHLTSQNPYLGDGISQCTALSRAGALPEQQLDSALQYLSATACVQLATRVASDLLIARIAAEHYSLDPVTNALLHGQGTLRWLFRAAYGSTATSKRRRGVFCPPARLLVGRTMRKLVTTKSHTLSDGTVDLFRRAIVSTLLYAHMRIGAPASCRIQIYTVSFDTLETRLGTAGLMLLFVCALQLGLARAGWPELVFRALESSWDAWATDALTLLISEIGQMFMPVKTSMAGPVINMAFKRRCTAWQKRAPAWNALSFVSSMTRIHSLIKPQTFSNREITALAVFFRYVPASSQCIRRYLASENETAFIVMHARARGMRIIRRPEITFDPIYAPHASLRAEYDLGDNARGKQRQLFDDIRPFCTNCLLVLSPLYNINVCPSNGTTRCSECLQASVLFFRISQWIIYDQTTLCTQYATQYVQSVRQETCAPLGASQLQHTAMPSIIRYMAPAYQLQLSDTAEPPVLNRSVSDCVQFPELHTLAKQNLSDVTSSKQMAKIVHCIFGHAFHVKTLEEQEESRLRITHKLGRGYVCARHRTAAPWIRRVCDIDSEELIPRSLPVPPCTDVKSVLISINFRA